MGVPASRWASTRAWGISSPAPLFVVAIDAAARTVVVGSKEELLRKTLHASRVNSMAGSAPGALDHGGGADQVRHAAAAATIEPLGIDNARVVFDIPQSAITPGQAVVFYEGDEVVGGGLNRRSTAPGLIPLRPIIPGVSLPRFGQPLEAALCVKRRHAARAGGGNRLPVDVVLHVAAGEHRGPAVCVPSWVTMYPLASSAKLARGSDVFGVWPIATNTPSSGSSLRSPVTVLRKTTPVTIPFLDVLHLFDNRVPAEVDLRVRRTPCPRMIFDRAARRALESASPLTRTS